MSSHQIDILMPTYNGSKYIRVLLDSLFHQTFTDWHLFVRDDHSKDDTISIIEEYSARYPGKITLIDDGLGNLGINKNFSSLLGVSKSNYACFCDQDDQWMPDKLEVSFKAMQRLEQKMNGKPCLIYSDLCLVNQDLVVINESLWKHDSLKPHYITLNKLLVQNIINGCVMMMNRPLVKLAFPVPPNALWFDHWVSLIAAASGKIEFINRTTINYRLHEFNSSRGDNRITKTDEEDQLIKKISNKNFINYFSKLEDQAIAVKERMINRKAINDASLTTIDTFTTLRQRNLVSRKWNLIKNGFFKHSRKGTLKWLARI